LLQGMDMTTVQGQQKGRRELCDYSVAEMCAGYEANAFTPVDVLEAVKSRVDACESTLNALWYPDFDVARDRAEQAAARWADNKPRGALDGVPVTVKENIARGGVPMPSGHAAGNPQPANHDAPITERLQESGAVIFASTVMP